MRNEEYLKTLYDGDLSYSDRQEVWIFGEPVTKKLQPGKLSKEKLKKWEGDIREHIHGAIDSGKLRQMKKKEECNLFVTFFINKFHPGRRQPRVRADVDNLVKILLDSLRKPKSDKKEIFRLFKDKNALMIDDVYVRGVRAEREMVKPEEKIPGAYIQYAITKSFKIINVKEKPGIQFRNYWESPMQYITACKIINGEESQEQCQFIDNMPGRLFLVDNEYAKLIPPGYDWKSLKGKIVDGCMIFEKKVLEEYRDKKFKNKEPNRELLHWLTKW